jgi:hypothetical protein
VRFRDNETHDDCCGCISSCSIEQLREGAKRIGRWRGRSDETRWVENIEINQWSVPVSKFDDSLPLFPSQITIN